MTLAEQRASVVREIGFRQSVYPRWVAAGKMPQEKADHEIAAMTAVLATLDMLAELLEVRAKHRDIEARQSALRG